MRIVIVDDELEIREYLSTLKGWEEEGCEVVGTASNGQEALRLLTQVNTDVLITDIRMPIMDGIELAKQVRTFIPQLPIIFLTAYHEFEYARQAVKLGISDFLTKPFLAEDLIRTVTTLREHQPDLSKWKEHDSLFQMMVSEDINAEDKLSWLTMRGVKDSFCQLLYAELDSPKEAISEHFPFVPLNLRSQITAAVGSHGLEGWTVTVAKGVYLLLRVPTMEASYREKIMRFANAIVSESHSNRNQSLSVGLSQIMSSLTALPEALRQVGKCMEYRMLLGRNSVVAFNALQAFLMEKEKSSVSSQSCVEDLLLRPDDSGIHSLLKESYRNLLSVGASKKEIQHFGLQLIEQAEAVKARLGIEVSDSDVIEIREKLLSAALLTDMMGKLEQYMIQIHQAVKEKLQEPAGKVLVEVKHIIKQDYATDLSLQDVANKLNMNYSYLSRLIKKETGVNFSELLWDLRIEEAKILLLREDLKAYEVAYKVGFKDTAHFSHLFKKKVGVSPSNYKAHILGQE